MGDVSLQKTRWGQARTEDPCTTYATKIQYGAVCDFVIDGLLTGPWQQRHAADEKLGEEQASRHYLEWRRGHS